MLVAVTGTPGAGKSFFTVRLIVAELLAGKCVATNVELVPEWADVMARRRLLTVTAKGRAKRAADFRSRLLQLESLDELLHVRLHGRGEGRGVFVIDEAHEWLNSRTWEDENRAAYISFFSEHRKRGWDGYVISQHIDSIDKQLRDRFEYQVTLRNLRRAKIAGIPIAPFNLFLAIWVWRQGPTTGAKHVAKRQLYGLTWERRLFDTHAFVGALEAGTDDDPDAVWLPRASHPPVSEPLPGSGGLSPEGGTPRSGVDGPPGSGDREASGGWLHPGHPLTGSPWTG